MLTVCAVIIPLCDKVVNMYFCTECLRNILFDKFIGFQHIFHFHIFVIQSKNLTFLYQFYNDIITEILKHPVIYTNAYNGNESFLISN